MNFIIYFCSNYFDFWLNFLQEIRKSKKNQSCIGYQVFVFIDPPSSYPVQRNKLLWSTGRILTRWWSQEPVLHSLFITEVSLHSIKAYGHRRLTLFSVLARRGVKMKYANILFALCAYQSNWLVFQISSGARQGFRMFHFYVTSLWLRWSLMLKLEVDIWNLSKWLEESCATCAID